MRRFEHLVLLLPLLLLASCQSMQKHSMLTPDKDGWITLFDGQTTNGWHTFHQKKAINWAVRDGCLTRVDKGGDLYTDYAGYENFVLELDWKISPGGNSGVFYRCDETDRAPW